MPSRKLLWSRTSQIQDHTFLHPVGKIEVERDDVMQKFVQQNIFQHTFRSQHFERLAHDDPFRIDRTYHVGSSGELVKFVERFTFDDQNVEVKLHFKKVADSDEFFEPGSKNTTDEQFICPPDPHRPSQRGAQKDQNERKGPVCTSNTPALATTDRFHPL